MIWADLRASWAEALRWAAIVTANAMVCALITVHIGPPRAPMVPDEVRAAMLEARLVPPPPPPREPIVLQLTQRCECQARTEFDPDEECDD